MLKALYNTIEEIPENYRDLFEERGEKFHLIKIEGIKTDADIARVERALTQEKDKAKAIKTQFESLLGDRKPEEVQAMLDKFPELEALAGGKLDEEKINGIVQGRIKTITAPIERELGQYKTKLTEAEQQLSAYQGKDRQRTVHDVVRSAAVKTKVLDTAQEDVLMLAERVFEINEDGSVTAKEGMGVTPGITPEIWLTEMQAKRPHWWPASAGGGAKGSGNGAGFAQNPWSADHWNLTEQGKIVTAQGQEKAEIMAKSAGSYIGATRPAAKK